MNPRRWGLRSAWMSSLVAVVMLASPVRAQFAEPSPFDPELPPDPIARSARLLGMGRLTLLEDRDNRIQFWNFGALAVGLYDLDSVSTMTLRPATRSYSSSVDLFTPNGDLELQDAASRESGFTIEAMRRPGHGTAYGVVARVRQGRTDALYSSTSERRSQLTNPLGMPVVAGRLPFLSPEHLRYAVFGILGINDSRDEYRRLTTNAAGQFVDHSGTLMPPPNYFDPDEYFVRRVGGGLSLAYLPMPSWHSAVSLSIVSNGIEGTNEGDRYASEVRERRPIYRLQASTILRAGASLVYGVEGEAWRSSSQSTYVFTISPSGGPGPARPPLTGRGDLSKRTEDGERVRMRVNLGSGPLGAAASFGAYHRRSEVTPAPLSSPNSFNSFRIRAFSQVAAADTIAFPEDALSSDVEQKDWEAAGGLSARFGSDRGMIGVEGRMVRRQLTEYTGRGAFAEEVQGLPQVLSEREGVQWDVRGGLEFRCTEVLAGRAGYIYRSLDRDELTELNEFLSNTVTAGFGLRPRGAHWSFDTGYAFEWGQADFGTPTLPRSTRQQLGMQVHWSF